MPGTRSARCDIRQLLVGGQRAVELFRPQQRFESIAAGLWSGEHPHTFA
jgi:hypothetical protein